MNGYKIKSFRINQDTNESIEIKIAELCEVNYGYYIWPCSIKMARFIHQNRNGIFNLKEANLLEIGSGTSLPAIIARKFCNLNRVIITDHLEQNSKLFDLIKKTLNLNKIDLLNRLDDENSNGICLEHFDWSDLDQNFFKKLPKIDFVIGSDVFFDSAMFEDLIVAISFLIEFINKNLEFYTTYEIRSFNSYLKLLHLIEKYSLNFIKLEIPEGDHSELSGDEMEIKINSHEIVLLKIFKKI
ncbi:unnamed protein product [Brachionus calyciflorus]|uniref:Uncharacterized protein n=1 Tax=Brachionus calyciflorus TaxID=104777 RepID=A0A813LXP0_9BILA|nr:unnamed protein product [Brachionus calyciflorus]